MKPLPKLTYRFKAIATKISTSFVFCGFFAEIDKMITKAVWKGKGHRIFRRVKTILKMKNKSGVLATLIKMLWY